MARGISGGGSCPRTLFVRRSQLTRFPSRVDNAIFRQRRCQRRALLTRRVRLRLPLKRAVSQTPIASGTEAISVIPTRIICRVRLRDSSVETKKTRRTSVSQVRNPENIVVTALSWPSGRSGFEREKRNTIHDIPSNETIIKTNNFSVSFRHSNADVMSPSQYESTCSWPSGRGGFEREKRNTIYDILSNETTTKQITPA